MSKNNFILILAADFNTGESYIGRVGGKALLKCKEYSMQGPGKLVKPVMVCLKS